MKKKSTAKKTTTKTKKTVKKVTAKTPRKTIKKTPVKSTPVETKSTAKKKQFSYIKASIIVALIGVLALSAYMIKNYFIVATVDGRPVTRYEIMTALEKQYGDVMLEALISQKLIEKEALDKNIKVTDDELNTELEKIKKQALEAGYDWDTILTQQNQTETTLREQLKYQLLIQKLLKDELSVTDEEVDDYINSYVENNKDTASDIEVTDEMKAKVKEGLENDKASSVITPWLEKLKGQADIKYIIKY